MGAPDRNEFEAASYESWRKLVERDLAGAPFEKRLVKQVAGLEVQPLYVAGECEPCGPPGEPPYTRGTQAELREPPWVVQYEAQPGEPGDIARAIRESLEGGATGVLIVLDLAARAGTQAHGVSGLAIENVSELETLLAPVDLTTTPIALSAGASAIPVAAGLFALARRRGLRLATLSGCLGIDPLGTLASHGALPSNLETSWSDAAEAARFALEHAPRVRALELDLSPYHEAGADAVLELALALASGIELLRALTKRGLSVEQVAAQLCFSFSLGTDLFVEIAKLRAARRTWARIVEAAGGGAEAQAMTLHARTSARHQSERDPWVNLLRGTAASFSAVLGGADVISARPHDAELGSSDGFGARLARNVQHLLRDEAQLGRVLDPAGGSYYVESLTTQLATRAWERMQRIEQAGGVVRALSEGTLQQELRRALEASQREVSLRRLPLVGVNEFANVHEPRPARLSPTGKALERAKLAAERSSGALSALRTEPGTRFASTLDCAGRGAAFAALRASLATGDPATVVPLVRERLARPFERLRDRADELAAQGERPAVLVAALGPIPEHKARVAYALSLLEAGGFAAVQSDPLDGPEAVARAFTEGGARLAVLCGSDERYRQLAGASAQALRAAGARAVALAGAPGPHEASYRAAGITHFLHVGVHVVDALSSLLDHAGAAR